VRWELGAGRGNLLSLSRLIRSGSLLAELARTRWRSEILWLSGTPRSLLGQALVPAHVPLPILIASRPLLLCLRYLCPHHCPRILPIILSSSARSALAFAGRWNCMPGRSVDLLRSWCWRLEGDEAGRGLLVPGEQLTAAAWPSSSTRCLAQPILGHTGKELMRSALLPLGIDPRGLCDGYSVAAYLSTPHRTSQPAAAARTDFGQL